MNIHPNVEQAARARGQRIDRFLRTASNDLMDRILAYSPPNTPDPVPPKAEAAPFFGGLPPAYSNNDDATSGSTPALPAGFAFHVDMNTGTGTPTGFTGATDSINGWAIDTFNPTIGSGAFKVGLAGSTGAKYAVSTGLPGFGLTFFTTSTKTSFQQASGFTFAYNWTMAVRVYVAGGDASNYGCVGIINKNPASATPVYWASTGATGAIGTQQRIYGPNISSPGAVVTSGTWVTLILKYNGAAASPKPVSLHLNGSPTATVSGTTSTSGEGGMPGFIMREQNGSASVLPRIGAGGIFTGLMSNQQMLDTHNYYASIWNSTTAP